MKKARFEALKAQQTTFIDDDRCKKGHPPIRYSKSGACVQCSKDHQTRSYKEASALAAQAKLEATVALYLYVHPADEQMVRDFVSAVNFQRLDKQARTPVTPPVYTDAELASKIAALQRIHDIESGGRCDPNLVQKLHDSGL